MAAARPESSPLIVRAPCACGCGETRALIGGGAARLGVAIPSVPAEGLPVAEAVRPTVDSPRAPGDVFLASDPIPI